MLQIYCSHCTNPWSIDDLHNQADQDGRSFNDVRDDFYRQGCTALESYHDTTARPATRYDINMVYELLGDDIDGAASELGYLLGDA